MDKGSVGADGRHAIQMRDYVDSMVKDITKSHKEREEQLSLAAQQYRENKRNLLHKYEELLIHYRYNQNWQFLCKIWPSTWHKIIIDSQV